MLSSRYAGSAWAECTLLLTSHITFALPPSPQSYALRNNFGRGQSRRVTPWTAVSYAYCSYLQYKRCVLSTISPAARSSLCLTLNCRQIKECDAVAANVLQTIFNSSLTGAIYARNSTLTNGGMIYTGGLAGKEGGAVATRSSPTFLRDCGR